MIEIRDGLYSSTPAQRFTYLFSNQNPNSLPSPKLETLMHPHFETGGCPMNVNDDDDHRICIRFSCFSVNPFESHRRFDCTRVVDIDLCYMESDLEKSRYLPMILNSLFACFLASERFLKMSLDFFELFDRC